MKCQREPLLIVQDTDLEEAQHAIDVGADVVVAQGDARGEDTERNRTLDIAR